MDIQDFINLFDRPVYRMCELHRPHGVLPFSRQKIYKDLRAGEFPPGLVMEGAGRIWTKQMLAEELLRRHSPSNEDAARQKQAPLKRSAPESQR